MGDHSHIRVAPWFKIIYSLLVFIGSQVDGENIVQVNVTFITDAVAKGAVCLDGTPGAYYYYPGFDDGVNNWIFYLPGGAWCDTKEECIYRSKYQSSGSNKETPPKGFWPLMRPNKTLNPDFYNWNAVWIRYCDGASFMADVEAVDPETNLHLRGRRIFASVMEELISTKGMKNAVNAVLFGNSAGGLAVILNCDRFRSFLPDASRVKCISESGFFIRAKDLPGAQDTAIDYFSRTVEFHKLAEYLPKSCTQRLPPELCFFAENVVNDIQTPLFLLNSYFDRYQLSSLVAPNPPNEVGWYNCTHETLNLPNCTNNQEHLIRDFRTMFLKTLDGLDDNPSRGLFIISCHIHDILWDPLNWQGKITLQNKTIQQAVGDWYFERSSVQLIDTEHTYPINCNLIV
ncbi:[Wnt protein] O-palmitoleoyl-L-serine hydrolase [Salvia divinorum]|uniref:Pectin acetylesterase n=1 Tax=Salvia divinorum TaxID=28513 RepID=A0ABD1H5H8_SALDI